MNGRKRKPAAICWLVLAAAAAAEDPGVAFFREQVKPLLAERCFRCHGGSDERGEVRVRGGLQLISRRGLLLGGDHGPAYDPEAPSQSLLLRAISYEDEDLRMPPRNRLQASEVERIRRWLEMGAPWTPEDADRLVEVDEALAGVTEVNDTTRAHWSYRPMRDPAPPRVEAPGHPIDAFLEARLSAEGLRPVPRASRSTLLRRLSYDLTGLPPTRAEIERFERDRSPDAWERQVERLLASPAYGEKWGRHWLDLVRYAESNGFERDADKPFVWRYRDYVIRSFNEDKPYDRFLTEQLAGDELAGASAESLIATGYLRLMPWDDEPADPLQHEFDLLDDVVRTTSEAMLGMTIGCARCHDHKGDPIPQRDYYRFLAFFRGIQPMGQGGRMTRVIDTPDVREDAARQLVSLSREAEEIRIQLGGIESRAMTWLRANRPDLAELVTGPATGDRVLVGDARGRPAVWHYTTEPPAGDWSTVGFRADEAGWRTGEAGFGTVVPGAVARTVWTGSDIWLQTTFPLERIPAGVVLHLYHDEDCEIYLNGRPVLRRSDYVTGYLRLPAPEEFLAALQTGRNVLSVHVRQSGGGQYFDLGVEIDGLTLADLVTAGRAGPLPEVTRENYRRLRTRLEAIERTIRHPGIEALVIQERGAEAGPTHVMVRGSAHSPADEVQPGFPAIWGGAAARIPEPAEGAASSGRRLALAEWITRPDHPRTARVMVNRIWQHHFGRGLCATPNDFGFLGETPAHPELLDWLALEFVRRGWSIKAMHRLILGSEAYRRSVADRGRAAEVDPENELWWRFNPRRLTAEEIRDSMLRAGGELNRQMFGEGIYVDLPAEVIATSSTRGRRWGSSPEDQRHRRSVYVKLKRSLVPPMFREFDFADTDNSCPDRFTTTVPTQALAMLNSEFVHRRADALAGRIAVGADDAARVRLAFDHVLSRLPSDAELARSLRFLREQREVHGLDGREALARFCLGVLNFNEFLYLD